MAYQFRRMKTEMAPEDLSISNAVALKSAELWLRLGEPMQALLELQHLPDDARKHPKALAICRAVYRAALSS